MISIRQLQGIYLDCRFRLAQFLISTKKIDANHEHEKWPMYYNFREKDKGRIKRSLKICC